MRDCNSSKEMFVDVLIRPDSDIGGPHGKRSWRLLLIPREVYILQKRRYFRTIWNNYNFSVQHADRTFFVTSMQLQQHTTVRITMLLIT
jgi:hypothetical protein